MNNLKKLFITMFFVISTYTIRAIAAESSLIDSQLTDFRNNKIKIYSNESHALIVFMAFGSKCPVVRKYVPEINLLSSEAKFKEKNVKFFLIQSELYDKRQDVDAFIKNYDLQVLVLKDPEQKLTQLLGLSISSEVAVYDSQKNKVIYQGAIDDSVTIDATKMANNHYLRDALEKIIEGKDNNSFTSFTKASGCHITFDKKLQKN